MSGLSDVGRAIAAGAAIPKFAGRALTAALWVAFGCVLEAIVVAALAPRK